MIVALHVRQFALFEKIDLDLNAGMTVFTGETGAGKSILVDALGAVFGARANADWVRHGAEKAEVIVELVSHDARLSSLLDEQDIDCGDGIQIRRVINNAGRSRAWVNGTPTSAALLKKIGHICLDLHGQHEHQTLLQEDFQQQLIDTHLNQKLLEQVNHCYANLRSINKKIEQLNSNRHEAQNQEMWMRDECERLLNLQPELGLEQHLERETSAARNIEHIQQAAAHALAILDEQDGNVRALLSQASHQLMAVGEHHPALQEANNLLNQMENLAGEISPYLQEALDQQIDIDSLAASEDRLAGLRDAMRRHHCDEQGLVALLASWQDKLNALDTAAWDEEALGKAQTVCMEAYQQAAQAMHQARKVVAQVLVKTMRPFLDQLGLKNMQLEVSIQAQTDAKVWKAHGWDKISFLAAANPGEPFKNLADTASGGELSRLVLALKGCGALQQAPATAIFDEIDVGIGGETGWCVGDLLRKMGQDRQVLVVSHLPQVAASADHQVAIEKFSHAGRTKTQLTMLQDVARHEEIARMLGGANEESLHHATQMLNRGGSPVSS